MKARLLLVEDDEPQRKTLNGFLKKRGFQVTTAASAAEAETSVRDHDIDLLITDLRLGGPDGISLLETLRQKNPDLQALVLTAYGTTDDAVRAMRAGAYDFLAKPVELTHLEAVIHKALEHIFLSREVRGLKERVRSEGVFDKMVGESLAMQGVKDIAVKVASSRASVLLLGESGTGKEVLARSIHRASPRFEKPFVTINCAALSESLIESELFGHVKGAFTGAHSEKKGRFEIAHEGTLFLDEVGDIPLAVQVKLLNVLQSGSYEAVGSSETKSVDVRIIAATHRDLEKNITEGLFREDLYYRLNVVSITVPPLRERPDDVALLVEHFLHKHGDLASTGELRVAEDVIDALKRWPFNGNVRQLENWIERAVVLATSSMLSKKDFPTQLYESPQRNVPSRNTPITEMASDEGLDDQVAALETTLISGALKCNKGNKSAAARDLGITERAIRYKIKKYGLE